MTNAVALQQAPYMLGHSQDELLRLIGQAHFFGDLTAHMLRLAGLAPGMRVLDIGCGAGDIAFLAASIVGPGGAIIGVDKAAEATALATQRAATAGLRNLRFVTQDLADYQPDSHDEAPFDALIGSRVLMYFADPAVILRRLVEFVRPGGLIALQEFDITAAKSEPPCPLFELAVERIRQTFTRAGADIRAGLKLGRIFEEAGLPTPQMLLGARVERGPDSEIYDQVTGVTRALLPLMERTGVAATATVGVDTLANRLREATVGIGATLVSPSLIGAWARKE